jgi:hypothetical protein
MGIVLQCSAKRYRRCTVHAVQPQYSTGHELSVHSFHSHINIAQPLLASLQSFGATLTGHVCYCHDIRTSKTAISFLRTGVFHIVEYK